MSAPLCPACNRPLPAAVVNGPAQAVVRCEGCQTLLLWSNGRVMRSAKSSTPTIMGLPTVAPKPAARDADSPLPELRPEADAPVAKAPTPPRAPTPAARPAVPRPTMMGIGENVPTRVAPPTPELRKEAARKDPAPAPVKNAPSGPIKTSPSGPIKTAPSGPIKTAPSGPIKTAPSGPIKTGSAPSLPAKTPASGPIKTGAVPTAPAKSAPSGPTKLPPPATPAKPAATATSDAGKSEAPHVVAAVAQVPKMGGGDMVDPSAWFNGDVSDVVPPEKLPPIESARTPQGETTGAQPLPPPPELPSLPPLEVEPFEIEPPSSDKTPPIGTRMPELDSAPIAVSAREPSQKIATREPSQKIATREPSQKIATAPPPAKRSPSAIRGAEPQVPPPARAVSERATVMGRPALERPPKPAEPVAAAIDLLPPPKKTPPSTTAAEATTPPTGTPSLSALSPSSSSTSAPSPAVPAAPSMVNVEPAVAAEAPRPATTSAAAEATNQTLLPMQPETTRVPREISRRTLFLVGGAASGVIVLVVLVIALAHGGKAPPAKPIAPPPVATAPTPPPAPTPPAPPPPPAPTPTAAPPAPEPTEAAAPTPPRPRRTLGGKKVVLEYDPKPSSPTPPPAQAPTPMGEDPATVARAREAYHKGNVKLFAGDDDGAIALYRESLKIYPGYVAGYRGLGLAFEEAGRKADALTAFHTYVRTVPNAVDAAIIRRRIEHLESEK